MANDLHLAEPCYIRVMYFLEEIRDGLKDLAGHRVSLLIDNVLDMDSIRQKLQGGLDSWEFWKEIVTSILSIVMEVQVPLYHHSFVFCNM